MKYWLKVALYVLSGGVAAGMASVGVQHYVLHPLGWTAWWVTLFFIPLGVVAGIVWSMVVPRPRRHS